MRGRPKPWLQRTQGYPMACPQVAFFSQLCTRNMPREWLGVTQGRPMAHLRSWLVEVVVVAPRAEVCTQGMRSGGVAGPSRRMLELAHWRATQETPAGSPEVRGHTECSLGWRDD